MVNDGVLTDHELIEMARKGYKVVDPFDIESVQPSSIDMRLGDVYIQYDLKNYIIGEQIDEDKVIKKQLDNFELDPGESILVGLYEKIKIPKNAMGLVMPRSSITRLGITIVPTYMNPEYEGYMPITIINNSKSKIIIKPMTRVVQLILISLSEHPKNTYKNIPDQKYFGETFLHSQIHLDQEINSILSKVMEKESPNLFKKLRDNEQKNL